MSIPRTSCAVDRDAADLNRVLQPPTEPFEPFVKFDHALFQEKLSTCICIRIRYDPAASDSCGKRGSPYLHALPMHGAHAVIRHAEDKSTRLVARGPIR